jgi:polyisoprenoid-binding protein YceI
MQKSTIHIFLWMICLLFFTACHEAKQQEDTVLQPAKSFLNIKQSSTWVADTAASYIKWTASSDDEKWHHGKVKLLSGDMGMQNNLPLQGHFVADLNTFEDRDFEDEQSKLDANRILRGSEYLDINRFPLAYLDIISADSIEKSADDNNVNVLAELSLKNMRKKMVIPARLAVDKHTCTLKANFRFNRRAYNIIHESTKKDDKGMNPDFVELELFLQASDQP